MFARLQKVDLYGFALLRISKLLSLHLFVFDAFRFAGLTCKAGFIVGRCCHTEVGLKADAQGSCEIATDYSVRSRFLPRAAVVLP